jgi:hypothetical protein
MKHITQAKRKLLIILLVAILSFGLIKFGFGEEITPPKQQPISYIEQGTIEKRVIVDANLAVNGTIECKEIKSRTTTGLIISNIIMGIIIFGILL